MPEDYKLTRGGVRIRFVGEARKIIAEQELDRLREEQIPGWQALEQVLSRAMCFLLIYSREEAQAVFGVLDRLCKLYRYDNVDWIRHENARAFGRVREQLLDAADECDWDLTTGE